VALGTHFVVNTELRSYMVHLSLEVQLQVNDLLQYWLKAPKSVILYEPSK
jgi:hypothetical protein